MMAGGCGSESTAAMDSSESGEAWDQSQEMPSHEETIETGPITIKRRSARNHPTRTSPVATAVQQPQLHSIKSNSSSGSLEQQFPLDQLHRETDHPQMHQTRRKCSSRKTPARNHSNSVNNLHLQPSPHPHQNHLIPHHMQALDHSPPTAIVQMTSSNNASTDGSILGSPTSSMASLPSMPPDYSNHHVGMNQSMPIIDAHYTLSPLTKVDGNNAVNTLMIARPDGETNQSAEVLDLPMMTLESSIEPTVLPLMTQAAPPSSTIASSLHHQTKVNLSGQTVCTSSVDTGGGPTHMTNSCHVSTPPQLRHSLGIPMPPDALLPEMGIRTATPAESAGLVDSNMTTADFELAMSSADDGHCGSAATVQSLELDALDTSSCTGSELLDQFQLDQISGLFSFRRLGNGLEMENDTNLNNLSHLGSAGGLGNGVGMAGGTGSMAGPCPFPLDLDKELICMLSTSTNSGVSFII